MKNNTTIFDNILSLHGENTSLSKIMDEIKSGKWKDAVEAYQSLSVDMKQGAKKNLPCFFGSGYYKAATRTGSDFIHNGFLVLDIDNVKNIDIIKERICADRYTRYCFKSISGNGLKVIIKININFTAVCPPNISHLGWFNVFSTYYNEKIGVIIDLSWRNSNSVQIISYDKDLYHNPKSQVM